MEKNEKNYDPSFQIQNSSVIESNAALSEKSRVRMESYRAENTIKAYSADWRDFCDWCKAKDAPVLPTTPETIVNYINDLADNAKANTVARRITAISENHIAAGYDREFNPAKSGLVSAAMRSIRREKGTFQKGKQPILLETIKLLSQCFRGFEDLTHLRDRALLWLGFAGAFRRSELVAVTIEDLTFTPQGLIVFIPRAKGDQTGQGSTIAIPFAPEPDICPVRAVKSWIEAAGLESGPLFHAFTRSGGLRSGALSDKSVANIVKEYVEKAGLDPKEFSGHSLRRGFATSAAQHDVTTLGIMKQTRHKSEKMVHRYIEQGKLFKDNPLDKMFR